MKNTKRYLVAVLALMLVVASMFVLGSCGHKHKYTSAVTDPTCTERGYTTYTCSCGDSYVDNYVDPAHDLVQHSAKPANCKEAGHEAYVSCKNCNYTTYVEIPAGEHYYEKSIIKIPTAENAGKAIFTCTGCGDSHEGEITLDDIELPNVMGFVASIIGDGYYSIDLGDGFNLILIKKTTETNYATEEEIFEGEKSFLAVKLPKAYLDIKDAYMKAELQIEVGTAIVEFEEGENPDEISFVDFDVESMYYLAIDGNKIDVKLESGEETEEYSATVYELALLLISRYTGSEIKYDSVLEVYAVLQQLECFVPVFETISEKLAALEKIDSDVDFTALISVLTALGNDVIEKNTEGTDTVYTLKLENLSEYIDYLKEATVADMLNDAFGEGFDATLKNFVVSIPNLTVKQIADTAITVSESYGLNVDEFYALVNGAVYLYAGTEFDIASEIDERNEYTIAKLVAEMMGAPAGSIDEIAASFSTQVEEIVTMILGSTVDDLFEMIGSLGAEAAPDIDDGDVLDDSVELEPEEKKSLTEILEGFVAMLGETVEATVVVDENGNVKDIDFSIAGQVTGSYEVNEDGNVSATIGLVGYSLNYSSTNGVYTIVFSQGEDKIVEGELNVTDDGYVFEGTLAIQGVTAELSVNYGLDGTLDVLVSYAQGVENYELSIKYDAENLDVVFEANEKKMFELYADILDGVLTDLKIDVHAILQAEEDGSEEESSSAKDPSHILSLIYSINDDGTYSFKFLVPVDEVEVDFKLNLETGTMNISGKQYGKNLFSGAIVITEEQLSMDITMYIDNEGVAETSKVTILWTAEEFKYIIRYNNQYDILNILVKFADGKITSATMKVEDKAYDDEGNPNGYYDLISLTYATEGNTGRLELEYYQDFKVVVDLTISDDEITFDTVVTQYEYQWDEEGNLLDELKAEVVFDGVFGIAVTSEEGTDSFTLSVAIDKLLTWAYDEYDGYDEEDNYYWVEIFEELVYMLNGEITFSYTEAE